MPQRGNIFRLGCYYHVYNRGRSGEVIFHNDANYEYCLRLVKKNLTRYEVEMIAYCLMPNHYHFLLRQGSTTPISKFISSTFISYVQALNKQLERSGPLFDGRYKHVIVDNEDYLIHLCRYIHLNPVKAGLVTHPDDWPFSNYLDWINKREGTLKKGKFIKDRFLTVDEYQKFVNDLRCEEEYKLLLEKYVFD